MRHTSFSLSEFSLSEIALIIICCHCAAFSDIGDLTFVEDTCISKTNDWKQAERIIIYLRKSNAYMYRFVTQKCVHIQACMAHACMSTHTKGKEIVTTYVINVVSIWTKEAMPSWR